MIEINLLPRGPAAAPLRRRSSRSAGLAQALTRGTEPWVIALAASGVLVLLLAGWSWWSTSASLVRLEQEVARELEDSTRHAATLALHSAARVRQDSVQQKLAAIREADAGRFLWPRLLDEISVALTPSTWLTRLSSSDGGDGGGPVIVVEGASASTQLLTRFMKNLEASPLLREVTLVTAEQTAGEGQGYSRFALEVRYEQPASVPAAGPPDSPPDH